MLHLFIALVLLVGTRGLAVLGQGRSRNVASLRAASLLKLHGVSSIGNSSSPRLAQAWSGKYGGLPPFANIKVSEFEPALSHGIERLREEVNAIAQMTDPPTFANTIAALEDVGRGLSRAGTMYFVYLSTMSTPEIREVEAKMVGPLASSSDCIFQSEKLFSRVKAIYEGPEYKTSLTQEEKRLTWKRHSDFVRNGAKLSSAQKTRLSDLNQQLAALYTKFRHNLLAESGTFVLIESEKGLRGLENSLIASLAEAAKTHGHGGKWAVMNTASVVEPFLTQAEDRPLREQVWRAFVNRGDNGDNHDNNAHIVEILRLRAERAKLLGYETHAHWQLENSMAGTPERVMKLLEAVWKPALVTVKNELKMQKEIIDREGAGIGAIEPWDYRFYMEKVRKVEYDIDAATIKPYMQLDQLREGMFYSAGKLFGLKFKELQDIPVAHPDIRVWDVREASGDILGLYYFDPYARSGKRSGAWMQMLREQEKFRGRVIPIVSNTCNYMKPPPGRSALVSWDDATTLFHEFGHALHGLLSNVNYPSLAGTSVARDYVEFPSQLYEYWLGSPEVLQRFALHEKTGKPIPESLVKKLKQSKTFNTGFQTVRFLASAFMDMKMHLAGDQQIEPKRFEKETLDGLGMPREIVMMHRNTQFAHAFGSDGYSAAYYSYLWSDTLTADAAEAFEKTGNMFDHATADKLRKDVLMVGNSIDPQEGFKAFRGRDVEIGALMRERGFTK